MTTTSELDQLLTAVRRLEAVEAVDRLHAAYVDAVDAKDVGAVSALFTPGATFVSPRGTHVGIEEIAASFGTGWADEPSQKRHFVTAVSVGALGDDGQAEVTARFFVVGRGDARSVIGWGRYRDRVEVADGVARFVRKQVALETMTDLATGWAADPVPG